MKTSGFQEKLLFTKLKEKDKDAFVKAYDLYLDSIYRFVFFKVNKAEEAEDITSQVFLKSWDYIQNNSIKDYDTLKSLLYKIARNLVIDYYRKSKNKSEVSYNLEEGGSIDIEDERQNVVKQVSIQMDCDLIEEKLFELKDEYREVITMRYINELSITEISQILDKPKGNVRVLVFRAIKSLKEIIGENEK